MDGSAGPPRDNCSAAEGAKTSSEPIRAAMQAHLFHNPKSGSGDRAAYELEAVLGLLGHEVGLFSTKRTLCERQSLGCAGGAVLVLDSHGAVRKFESGQWSPLERFVSSGAAPDLRNRLHPPSAQLRLFRAGRDGERLSWRVTGFPAMPWLPR